MTEPVIRVGLAQGREQARITLRSPYELQVDGRPAGRLEAGSTVELGVADGQVLCRVSGDQGTRLRLIPVQPDASFLLHDMTVGIGFHWEHDEDLAFSGEVSIEARAGGFDVVNPVPLETYLLSVISSEMSARSPSALLQAHAIISRSWLLAQLQGAGPSAGPEPDLVPRSTPDGLELVRWYDREDHEHFDVCADDHCQRYQGVTRAFTDAARAAIHSTRGVVLLHAGAVCDARFSKCCGGMTEVFSSAWGDAAVPYLESFPDSAGPTRFSLPLTDEDKAVAFISGAPPAFCNAADRDLLERLLPELDHDTVDFYRWELTISAEQVRDWVKDKAGVDLGPVRELVPLRRGPSGRITRLAIVGDRTLRVGKELEIRRLLSDTHLYSSAFTVSALPGGFRLRGAGWGHGVGLCQIGAAVMASRGYDHRAILAHYYRHTELVTRY